MSQSDAYHADAIILGAGLIGLTQALALAKHGLRSIIIDRADPAPAANPNQDMRVSAINSSSWNMFKVLGVADKLAPHACPIRQIIVNDSLKEGVLDFAPSEEVPLGMMIENDVLRRIFFAQAMADDLITFHMPASATMTERGVYRVDMTLSDGKDLIAPVMIAADGRESASRGAAGISLARWDYDHSALICTITHEIPHDNIAYEIFYPDGPLALLPMLDTGDGLHRCAVVWTVSREDGPAMARLSERAFGAELQKKMGGFLGSIEIMSPRASYPLGFHYSANIVAQRLALVGDAAHAIHPIAGQGLNLGLRDVAALTQCLVDAARTGIDLGDTQILARYDRWRSLDNLMVASSTDILTRLFGLPGDASSAIRRFGMGMIQKITPIKNRLMAEARGESGDLPRLLQGEAI